MTNKKELGATMAIKSGLTQKDSELALNAMVESITEFLDKKDNVQLIGFGTFETRKRAAREGRNPQIGKALK